MPRTVIYDRPIRAGQAALDLHRPYAHTTRPRPEPDELLIRSGDDFASRLVKYIPAEALALVALISSIEGIADAQIVAIVIVGGIGQLFWLNHAGRKLDPADRPTRRQYGFALLAYIAWVLGISPEVDQVLGVDRTTGTIAMASAAYLLPLVDDKAHEHFDPDPEEPLLRR